MHRLIVLILAAVDAAVAAAVGLAATLAPLTLLWVFGLGGTAQWSALWPASATLWQFGNLVPLQVALPGEYLAAAGIDTGAASFVLSLAPLAFAAFAAVFAARSGVRASKADAWVTGAVTGTLVFAAIATLVALTSATDIAGVQRWQAILFPALVFAIPLWAGAVVTEWREAGGGVLARFRDRIEASQGGWGEVAGLVVRGGAIAVVGLVGAGAVLVAVSLLVRGGEVIALFEAAHVDALGAIVVTLAQAAYLPVLVIWGLSFVAGPGFALGVGTSVSPAGTQLGVIPGIPILGVVPESTTPWLLLLALVPIALGALAGWVARSRLVAVANPASPAGERADTDPVGPRVVIALGIAAFAGASAALLGFVASGAIGPGRLATLGPQPGPLALAVGLEVLLGAAILLLSPRRRRSEAEAPIALAQVEPATSAVALAAGGEDGDGRPMPADHQETAPIVPVPVRYDPDPDDIPTAEFGPRRPTLPPSG
ncbi:cell division protein PerM [Microbacterium pygmaeum]|uniref:Uncharacterized protein n=1 Tax=Microbacterium pygmaeum TaxID=370764 RepID=A0A1G8DB74_9MICO|nr:DUF6350 family protein [Microbacterium pygmaeum]SDH54639.1 hypothetical protein SAMN04489810_3294 [Microbacterium pygmaeum]